MLTTWLGNGPTAKISNESSESSSSFSTLLTLPRKDATKHRYKHLSRNSRIYIINRVERSKITSRSDIVDKIVAAHKTGATVANDDVIVDSFHVVDVGHLTVGIFLCVRNFGFSRDQIGCCDYWRMGKIPNGLKIRIINSGIIWIRSW